MSEGTCRIEIPRVPPSLNTWLSKGFRQRYKDKSEWETLLRLHLHQADLPKSCDRIEAAVTFRFPDRRRRDHDNYTATLSKCLGDALRPEWVPDDNTGHFFVTDSRILPEVGEAQTTISLSYWRQPLRVVEAAA